MEQIYYTQCPIGYGLGASNGFQIKRLSAGYPVTGDFRHLGLRAFVAGTKVLAPAALRYRRDGAVAEVAWLTPRAQEYQTERGLWGRPGGHFAHGLRLSAEELAALSHWPAGLFDSPAWRRADPEPSRGRPPDPIDLGPAAFARPAAFAAVAPLAEGLDAERLARLLTALATAAREGRTLFLIDEADRLGPRVMLLTFAFPEALRPALTFSTYHDRPEELPGFRLQGTTPAARPNRPALASLGIVADLVAGTFEPAVVPSRWARTLAGWLVGRTRGDAEAWTRACVECAGRLDVAGLPEEAWADDRLDRLFSLPALLTPPLTPPASAEGWAALADATQWAGTVGLVGEFARARGPSWWEDAAATAQRGPEARAALLATLTQPDAWRGVEARAWAVPLARWFADAGPVERLEAIAAALNAAPTSGRPGLLAALLAALPARAAEEAIDWLKANPGVDRALLLPLEVRGALSALLDGRRPEALAELLRLSLKRRDVVLPVLDALAAEVEGRPKAREALDETLVALFDEADRLGRAEPWTWALRRSDAEGWLGPPLRRHFLDGGRDDWRRLRDRTPEELRPSLANVVLHVAEGRGGGDEAFRWGVEEVLLPLAEADRPVDPAWPDMYLKRSRSGLELVGKLFVKQTQDPALKRWLLAARGAGGLSPEQSTRLEQAGAYARALASRDARELLRVPLPDVPPAERGKVLRQVIEQVGGAKFEQLDLCLDSCRHAWPGAFEAGAPGLAGLAAPLARTLLVYRSDVDLWLQCLRRMLLRLELLSDRQPPRGFEPDGLAAHVVAATTRADSTWPPWRLRKTLLGRDEAWRALAVDAAYDLAAGPRDPLGVVQEWRAHAAAPATWPRLVELILNAADGPRLAALVGVLAEELDALGGPLSWWARPADGRDDLRDAFARLAPLAPLDGDLTAVRDWMREFRDLDPGEEVYGLAEASGTWRPQRKLDWSHLSPLGLARWRCLETLTEFRGSFVPAADRWSGLSRDEAALPLGQLDADERHRFVAWLIHLSESCEGISVPRAASFLRAHGVVDVDRLGRWADEIAGLGEAVVDARPDRLAFVSDLKAELATVLRESRDPPRKARGSP